MSDTIICCDQPAIKLHSAAAGVYTVECKVCGKRSQGETAEAAIQQFQSQVALEAVQPETITTEIVAVPSNPSNLPQYLASRMADLASIAVPFVGRNQSALTRLVKNTCRYIMSQKGTTWDRVWGTLEGQESIVHGLEESLTLGASMPEMGYLVPFGAVVEFIPKVEAYEFALTNGSNPPFAWIQIDMIHQNDIRKLSRVNGEFSCEIEPGIPRGELVAVAVYGYNNRLRHVIGEAYDVGRLLGKAELHSSSYKYFLQDKQAFQMARTEGKLKLDGTREYVEKTMYKKGGGNWTKKLYEDEIANPYQGADQPEMLRKAAGKSFLGKYARVRNAEAAMDEVSGSDEKQVGKMVDATIEAAFANMDTPSEPQPKPKAKAKAKPKPPPEPDPEPDVVDVEVEPEPTPPPKPNPETKFTDEFKQKVAASAAEADAGEGDKQDDLEIW